MGLSPCDMVMSLRQARTLRGAAGLSSLCPLAGTGMAVFLRYLKVESPWLNSGFTSATCACRPPAVGGGAGLGHPPGYRGLLQSDGNLMGKTLSYCGSVKSLAQIGLT